MTWNLLYDEYKRSLALAAEPRALPLFPLLPDGYEIALGEQSFAVMAIQYMLGEIRLQYDNIEAVAQTGIYNEETDTAIREFQTRNLLPATGTVNKTTWDLLVGAYELIYKDNKQ
ncbi:MAG: peptidoglycan-binding protein [Clostridia bacterium]|nr:peptidoglycan-binding protein [Clostridia bacterium]